MKTLLLIIILSALFLFCATDKTPLAPTIENHQKFYLKTTGIEDEEGNIQIFGARADIQYPIAICIWATNGNENFKLKFDYWYADSKYTYYLLIWFRTRSQMREIWATNY